MDAKRDVDESPWLGVSGGSAGKMGSDGGMGKPEAEASSEDSSVWACCVEHTEGELCAETGTHIRISAGTLSSPPLINIPLLCGLVMSEVLVGRASDGAGTRAFEG